MQAGEQQQQADDSSMHLNATTDWDDSEASLNQISTSIKGKADSTANGQAGAGTNGSNDNLWEDNWDDDDIEDDFSVQLRYVVLLCTSLMCLRVIQEHLLMSNLCHCRKAISEQNGPQDMAT